MPRARLRRAAAPSPPASARGCRRCSAASRRPSRKLLRRHWLEWCSSASRRTRLAAPACRPRIPAREVGEVLAEPPAARRASAARPCARSRRPSSASARVDRGALQVAVPVAELANREPHGEMRFGRRRGAARVLQRLRAQHRPIDLGAPQRMLAHQRERGVDVAHRGRARPAAANRSRRASARARRTTRVPCPRTLTPNAISSTSPGNGSSISSAAIPDRRRPRPPARGSRLLGRLAAVAVAVEEQRAARPVDAQPERSRSRRPTVLGRATREAQALHARASPSDAQLRRRHALGYARDAGRRRSRHLEAAFAVGRPSRRSSTSAPPPRRSSRAASPPASSASKPKFCCAHGRDAAPASRRRGAGRTSERAVRRERARTVAQAERSAGRSGTSGLTSRTSTWNRSRSPSTASRSGGDNHDNASAAVCASPSLARAVMNMTSG